MKKNLYFIFLLLLSVSCAFVSCSDDDSDNKTDQTWIDFNNKVVNDIKNSYNALESQANDKKVLYWKTSDVITNSDKSVKATSTVKPLSTDTVVIRYEAWYLKEDKSKVIFRSTENPSIASKIDRSAGLATSIYPNKVPVTLTVNPASMSLFNNKAEGLSTLLQDMTVGEEREACIPYSLGFDASSYTYQPVLSSTTVYRLVPAYTTLWFRIKLIKIIPMSGLSS